MAIEYPRDPPFPACCATGDSSYLCMRAHTFMRRVLNLKHHVRMTAYGPPPRQSEAVKVSPPTHGEWWGKGWPSLLASPHRRREGRGTPPVLPQSRARWRRVGASEGRRDGDGTCTGSVGKESARVMGLALRVAVRAVYRLRGCRGGSGGGGGGGVGGWGARGRQEGRAPLGESPRRRVQSNRSITCSRRRC